MALQKQIKHRGPAQQRVLDDDVIILRLIDPRVLGRGLHEVIAGTNLGHAQLEGDMPWFLENYVAADQPRNANMAKAIMEATIGYAIARTDSGDILTTFNKNELNKAERVASRAKVELAVDVALKEDDEDDGIADGSSDEEDSPRAQ